MRPVVLCLFIELINLVCYAQERAYIHYDRDTYVLGDTLWFKAYLFDGSERSRLSTNFYVELVDQHGKVIDKVVAPILESTASGSVVLMADSSTRALSIRAYTASMVSDTAFVYLKDIDVLNYRVKHHAGLHRQVYLKFMPEGGRWVTGLPAVMAFKAVDDEGMPVNVSGNIVSDGKPIIKFASMHDGMGAFTILPQAGQQYTAVWQDDRLQQYTTALPPLADSGLVVHLENANHDKKFFVLRAANSSEADKILTLSATAGGKLFYKIKLNLIKSEGTNGIIPVKNMPSGIVTVTVVNNENKVVAERITFVNNHNYAFKADTALKINTSKRALNTLSVQITDTLRSTLSVAVTDADAEPANLYRDNIVSHLLLTGELRGKIIDPYYYFKDDADSTARQLELVMLTSGWRAPAAKSTTGKSMANRFLSVSGKLSGVHSSFFRNSPVANIIIQAADSSSVMVPVIINNDGTFFKDGLIFYNESKLFFKFTDKHLASAAQLNIRASNGLLTDARLTIRAPLPAGHTSQKPDSGQLNRLAIYKPDAAIKHLQEVTIKEYKPTAIDKLDKTYATGMFTGTGNYKNVDIANDPKKINYLSIFQYLRMVVPGIKVYNDLSVYPYATWRQGAGGELPVFFCLNNFKCSAGDISKINIEEFDYLKIYDPSEAGFLGNPPGGAIAVYTKRGRGISVSTDNNKSIILQGYTPAKEFYSPDYASIINTVKPDTRVTLYWNPNLLLNSSTKQQTIRFYNSDVTHRFRVVIEGINTDGKLIHMEKVVN